MTALLERTEVVPGGPERVRFVQVATGDQDRVAAFVFELDTLFDTQAFDIALARLAARKLAAATGGDPLWLEVRAVQMVRAGEDPGVAGLLEELALLQRGTDDLPDDVLDRIVPVDDPTTILGTIHRRFKLALVSNRGRKMTTRILTALGLSDAFDVVACTEPGTAGLRQLCTVAAEQLEEPATDCVLVGRVGSPALRAATVSGMQTVGLGRDTQAVPNLVLPNLRLVEGLAAGAAAKYRGVDEELADDADYMWVN